MDDFFPIIDENINPCRGCPDYDEDGCKSNGGCGKHTNADRLRAMSDEELAVQLALPYLAIQPWCSEHITCPYISEDPTLCDKCVLDWLRQEAQDG